MSWTWNQFGSQWFRPRNCTQFDQNSIGPTILFVLALLFIITIIRDHLLTNLLRIAATFCLKNKYIFLYVTCTKSTHLNDASRKRLHTSFQQKQLNITRTGLNWKRKEKENGKKGRKKFRFCLCCCFDGNECEKNGVRTKSQLYCTKAQFISSFVQIQRIWLIIICNSLLITNYCLLIMYNFFFCFCICFCTIAGYENNDVAFPFISHIHCCTYEMATHTHRYKSAKDSVDLEKIF